MAADDVGGSAERSRIEDHESPVRRMMAERMARPTSPSGRSQRPGTILMEPESSRATTAGRFSPPHPLPVSPASRKCFRICCSISMGSLGRQMRAAGRP